MSEQQTDWQKYVLGDDITLISGQHILASDYSEDPVGVPYLTGPSDFPDGLIHVSKYTTKPKQMCEVGDVLLTVKGSGTGKIIRADKQYCISRQLMAVRPTTWDRDFVFYLLDQMTHRFENAAAGLIPGISRDQVLNSPVCVPSLPEQRKIAQILRTWDEAIAAVEQLIAALQRRKKGLMQQLLTGQVRFPGFAQSREMRNTVFGVIPTDWDYETIGHIAKEVVEKNRLNGDLPVLSCTKYDGLVDSLTYFGRRVFSENVSGYKVVKRGQFAYATNHIEEGSIGYQNLYDRALISPMYTVFETESRVHDPFLYRVLKTELYRHIFEVNTSGTVNRRGRLGWSDFARIRVPLPDLTEQRRIAEFFDVVDAEIAAHSEYLDQLKTQKKGLMQRLLTGQVRVYLEEPT